MLPHRCGGRKKQSDHDRNDGEYDEKFDECECGPSRWATSTDWMNCHENLLSDEPAGRKS
jgi:hypothetical protein